MEETSIQSNERIKLRGHPPHSRVTIHGWPAFLLGIPFVGAGGTILLLALGRIDYPSGSIHAPLWVVGVFSGAFLPAGFALVIHGGHGIHRRSRLHDEKRRRPGSPWLWDFLWQRTGISENKLGTGRE